MRRLMAVWILVLVVVRAADIAECNTLQDKDAFEQRRADIYADLEPIVNDPEAMRSLKRHSELLFGFNAYKSNFIMPVKISNHAYPSYVPSDKYGMTEAEIQFSISYDLFADLFGLDGIYGAAVTEHAFWQVYATSAPFREMVFNPELYALFPFRADLGFASVKTLKLTFSHMSNGQGNIEKLDVNQSEYPEFDPYWLKNRSRSWNYVSGVFRLQSGALLTDITMWLRTDDGGEDDNPDIVDYLGFGQLDLHYYYRQHQFDGMVRLNPLTKRGAVEAGWSFPVHGRDSVYWYIKGFSGYGESLIDYDRAVNSVAFGFSFFR